MPAITQPEVDVLFLRLQRRLVESGDWDRICLLLKYKLNDAGWLDVVQGQSKEHARRMETMTFRTIMTTLEGSPASVPENVRQEVTTIIRQALERQLE
ncbi:hypothetical protein FA95DRAFT_1558321 [Auriscalpium vulgare]|uniref:Uncharacterized protein n=1 Tax=Auriscalpium vulgare TaxID=40419 RepID=A0ACB8RVB9_9AGAM|nr:hypothetical protein FA95DRAFT_1558321 [Auriscalpium vulgare]